jgi:hypothetical protein
MLFLMPSAVIRTIWLDAIFPATFAQYLGSYLRPVRAFADRVSTQNFGIEIKMELTVYEGPGEYRSNIDSRQKQLSQINRIRTIDRDRNGPPECHDSEGIHHGNGKAP